MEGTFTEAAGHLIQTYGLAGIVILVEGLVIWRLWNLAQSLFARIDAMQEARITAAREDERRAYESLDGNTTAMEQLGELVRTILAAGPPAQTAPRRPRTGGRT